MVIKISPTKLWESTDGIVIHNFPPLPNTFPYVCRVFNEYTTGEASYIRVEGPLFIFTT